MGVCLNKVILVNSMKHVMISMLRITDKEFILLCEACSVCDIMTEIQGMYRS